MTEFPACRYNRAIMHLALSYLSNHPFFHPNTDKLIPIANTPNTNSTGKMYDP